MRKIAVVTTFSKEGWEQYADRAVRSFDLNWPGEVDLHVYPDSPVELPKSPRIFSQTHAIPAKQAFIDKHRSAKFRGLKEARYNYRFDAVKFCHKPYALHDFMKIVNPTQPIPYSCVLWLDADTITHSKIPYSVVDRQMCPQDTDFMYLGRVDKYSECGWMYFQLPGALPLIDQIIRFYDSGSFKHQKEWHDSFLIDLARVHCTQTVPEFRTKSLTKFPRRKGGGHPFINSFLGKYMDHLKGASRKARGAPRPGDMLAGHNADYWRKHNAGPRPRDTTRRLNIED